MKAFPAFRWRSEDAGRNALNAWCYWTLRNEGLTQADATAKLSGQSIAQKNELLLERGINFNDVPAWQKRGVGLSWEEYDKPATNPFTGAEVFARRRRLRKDFELPMKDAYSELLRGLIC